MMDGGFGELDGSRVDPKVVGNRGIKDISGRANSGPTVYSPNANFFRRFPTATRPELAIRCALNRVSKSTDIQRLCPNLDRSPRECGGFRCKPLFR
jgi:hypothetical protein